MESLPLKASVVINTYNRAQHLANAMRSIAAQSYSHLELIVVNGPSTDPTESILDALEGEGLRFKRARCSHRNLAESRNVGIANAAGDVVFFLDDDAVAHREWVARLMHCYGDSGVGAAGGFTFDHTGISYQCRYTVCDRFGNARFFDTIDPATLLQGSGGFFFPSLLGTNCSFSRQALRQLGGFDEVFEYMLDETDVCCRIIESGKRIVTVPDAYVFHKYAASETRSEEGAPRSLLAPARSKAYYCVKHGSRRRDHSLELDVIAEVERYRREIEVSNQWHLEHRTISPVHYSRLSQELADGIAEGLRIGMNGLPIARGALGPAVNDAAGPFLGIRPKEGAGQEPGRILQIYLVSQGYPPSDTAGIARWTNACAEALCARGHEVHVITRSPNRADQVDFRNGV